MKEINENKYIDEKGHYWNDPNESDWITYNSNDILSGSTRSPLRLVPGWFVGKTENKWIGRNIKKYLSEGGRTAEEWYSRFMLNLDHVPKCNHPLCNNEVSLKAGKFFMGLNKYCCFEHQFYPGCPQSIWTEESKNKISNSMKMAYKTDESLYRMRSDQFKDPINQSNLQKRRIILKTGSKYGFYLAITELGNIKFGVSKDCNFEGRKFIQKSFKREEYLSIHGLFYSDNITISEFEYELKSKFGYKEYIPWINFHTLITEIRILINKFSNKIYRII